MSWWQLEAKTSMGFTPLHLAAQACSQECMHSLISKGADVNALDNVRASPLHIAVQLESPACVQQLLLAGEVDEEGRSRSRMRRVI